MKNRLLFLTLNTFSATGGIEKVCRAAGKALHEIASEEAKECAVFSMYDKQEEVNGQYFPAAAFKGFGGRKIEFVWQSVQKGLQSDVVLLSHINLLSVGYLIKKFSPKTKLFVIAHGIELWEPLQGVKRKMLKAVDLFLPVSSFTAQKLHVVHGIPAYKRQVVNNCLDPFIKQESDPEQEKALKIKYGYKEDDFILLTLTRLKFSEQYKGYDKVVEALKAVKKTIPAIKYMVAGKYDVEEKARLDTIITANGLTDSVVFTGFVKDEELNAHFNIADAYIMPSTGEGFGIVFIEALFYGLPVIAGNVDGSSDALDGGRFGLLVNPAKQEEIVKAILDVFANRHQYTPVHNDVVKHFGFEAYKRNLHSVFGETSSIRLPQASLGKSVSI